MVLSYSTGRALVIACNRDGLAANNLQNFQVLNFITFYHIAEKSRRFQIAFAGEILPVSHTKAQLLRLVQLPVRPFCRHVCVSSDGASC